MLQSFKNTPSCAEHQRVRGVACEGVACEGVASSGGRLLPALEPPLLQLLCFGFLLRRCKVHNVKMAQTGRRHV